MFFLTTLTCIFEDTLDGSSFQQERQLLHGAVGTKQGLQTAIRNKFQYKELPELQCFVGPIVAFLGEPIAMPWPNTPTMRLRFQVRFQALTSKWLPQERAVLRVARIEDPVIHLTDWGHNNFVSGLMRDQMSSGIGFTANSMVRATITSHQTASNIDKLAK